MRREEKKGKIRKVEEENERKKYTEEKDEIRNERIRGTR